MKSLAILALVSTVALADHHVVDELVMPTEVGEIVLTIEECTLHDFMNEKYHANFKYRAYATDPQVQNPHEGCWAVADNTVYIQFPELGDVLATYKKDLFKPRKI